MPPKSDYWKHFVVQGVLAVCQLPGCPKPNVSLGAPPKPGQKKRISEYKLFHSCSKLKMFSFSIWRSHQPFGKASPIWVECILWDEGKEGGSGVRGQGGGEGELWDGELGGALLWCQVKCQHCTCTFKYHTVSSVPCTSHHQKYRLCTTVTCQHCTCIYL